MLPRIVNLYLRNAVETRSPPSELYVFYAPERQGRRGWGGFFNSDHVPVCGTAARRVLDAHIVLVEAGEIESPSDILQFQSSKTVWSPLKMTFPMLSGLVVSYDRMAAIHIDSPVRCEQIPLGYPPGSDLFWRRPEPLRRILITAGDSTRPRYDSYRAPFRDVSHTIRS